ncbi:MAG: C10 family peptidase, partial [Alistipes sp.]|nr:C10 family peptidase [Alistipes sp.]
PLLSTEWHQRLPYNYYCPVINDSIAVAGCVPIAIAQIMAYHKYPPVVNGYSIDWTLVESGAMEDSLHYAARVVREVGREANADYGTKVTTATNSEAKQALRAFGYSVSSYETYSDVRAKLYLGLQRPILARGDNVDGGVGHMWVIDGYLKNKNVNYYYNMQPPYSLYKTITEYQHYVHCNWGWGSYYNCYCLEDSFFFRERNQPQETHDYDNVQIIPNIHY